MLATAVPATIARSAVRPAACSAGTAAAAASVLTRRPRLGARRRLGGRRGHGSLVPAAAQRLVQVDEVRLPVEPRLDEDLLRREEIALRGQHREVAVDAAAV